MLKRTFFITILLPILLTNSLWAATKVSIREDSVIDVVYMGGTDCPPCRMWKIFDLPKLRESKEFPHIRFTEVKKWIPDPVPAAKDLPEHLQSMHDELERVINSKKGSPFFALLVDGKGVKGGFGQSAYDAIRPLITELVDRKLSAVTRQPVPG